MTGFEVLFSMLPFLMLFSMLPLFFLDVPVVFFDVPIFDVTVFPHKDTIFLKKFLKHTTFAHPTPLRRTPMMISNIFRRKTLMKRQKF